MFVTVNLFFPELQRAQEFAKEYGIEFVYNEKIRKWQCEEKYNYLFKTEERNGRICFGFETQNTRFLYELSNIENN